MAATFGDRRSKSFEFAADATKQLIALATGIVAFTVTFAKEFLASVSLGLKVVAAVSWFFYFASAVAGLLILYALAGQLDPGGKSPNPDEKQWSAASIWAGAVRILMMVQQGAFGLGLLITVLFAVIALFTTPSAGKEPSAATYYYYNPADVCPKSRPVGMICTPDSTKARDSASSGHVP